MAVRRRRRQAGGAGAAAPGPRRGGRGGRVGRTRLAPTPHRSPTQPAPRPPRAGELSLAPAQGGTALAARQLAAHPATPRPPSPSTLPWTDACAPAGVADLVVHPKKRTLCARGWRAGAARAAVAARGGPPGCGKAATVTAVAAEAGMRVLEWVPPLQATWDEAKYVERGAGGGARALLMRARRGTPAKWTPSCPLSPAHACAVCP